MVQQIIETASSIFDLIPSLFESLSSVFWTAGTGDIAGSLTFVGTLAIAALGLALAFTGFRIVRGFMHLRG